jgi:hypothetical protein
MAGLPCLHKESTYALSKDSTSDEIVNSEKMRHTFWMLESQDNLHSGHNTLASFSLAGYVTRGLFHCPYIQNFFFLTQSNFQNSNSCSLNIEPY